MTLTHSSSSSPAKLNSCCHPGIAEPYALRRHPWSGVAFGAGAAWFPVPRIGPGSASGGLGALRWGAPLPEQQSWEGKVRAAGEDEELEQSQLLREQIASSHSCTSPTWDLRIKAVPGLHLSHRHEFWQHRAKAQWVFRLREDSGPRSDPVERRTGFVLKQHLPSALKALFTHCRENHSSLCLTWQQFFFLALCLPCLWRL